MSIIRKAIIAIAIVNFLETGCYKILGLETNLNALNKVATIVFSMLKPLVKKIKKNLCKISGCQIILCKELDGMEVELPKATRNFYVDGHVPAPH